jgi:hypothetical protein
MDKIVSPQCLRDYLVCNKMGKYGEGKTHTKSNICTNLVIFSNGGRIQFGMNCSTKFLIPLMLSHQGLLEIMCYLMKWFIIA